ncbi:TonB-dependent receptor [Aquisediminimonas profunda]|uniref:TonB-dependent receptor n=1 Tax=Aquisediminimonas profunda TaxID=1550733 RepID=UPI001C636157|nr:TonB-dependent receptor [Aquisediminimonas profunda]
MKICDVVQLATKGLAPVLVSGILAGPCLAQAVAPAAGPAEEVSADDIVVTAQKRSERLQDVPVSISAIGGDNIMKQRITQSDDLVTKTPNLQLAATVGENTPIFSLRGVSMSDFSLNQSGPVATYYDEVYKGNFALLGVALYDIERVEVLRGPQGTLYGKNTTGGAVNLISKRPEFSNEAYLNVGAGNYGRYEANGAVNVALSDTLSARVAFTYAHADGWFRNQLPNKPDLNGTNEYGIRGSLRWEPSASASFVLRASTSLQNPYNYGVFAQPVDAAGIGGTGYVRAGLNNRQIESNYTPKRRARTYAVALTGNFDIGNGLGITSVTSYDRGTLSFGEDTDGSPTQTLELPYFDRARQFSQDLRLTSDWSGPFNFILGAYYNRETVFNAYELRFFNDVDVNGDGSINATDCADAFATGSTAACRVGNSFDQKKSSYALYSDLRYNFGSGFTLRGGLRFTHDTGDQTNLRSVARGVDDVFVLELIPSTNSRFTTNNLSGKIGLDYKSDGGALFYANYGRGYRASSFNAQAFFDPSEVSIAKPEEIDAFEVGAKTRFLDRRATLNTSAFYYIYRNQQFINVNPTTIAQTLINVDRSRILGAEVELNVKASDSIGLRAGLGLLDTKVEKGLLTGTNLAGNKLLNAPAVNFSGGADVTAVRWEDGQLSFHGDVSYVSSQFFEVFNVPRLRQDGYVQLGGHIDIEHGPWTLSLWGKNLTNRFFFTSRIDVSGLGFDYNHVGAPRSFGVVLGRKF